MTITLAVENAIQAKSKVESLELQGYSRDNIYIFAHGDERETDIARALDTEKVGMKEQGFFNALENVFAKRGDELRSELKTLGLSPLEAEAYERELDAGKLVIVAKN